MSASRLTLLYFCCAAAPALASDLITEPEAAFYVAPTIYNGNLVNRMGDTTIASPTWHIAQWDNPQPFAAGQIYSGNAGSDWSFSTHTARVEFYSSGSQSPAILEHTHELAQQGADLSYPLPCGSEYDLFIEDNNGVYKDPTGLKAASRFETSRPLSQVSTVTFRFGLAIPFESVTNTCSLNYAGYLVAADLTSSKGYLMFFQVFLRDSRGAVQNNTPCVGYPINKTYCFSSTIDQVVNGQPMQSAYSGRVAYAFNVLPFLSRAISSTPDNSLADWQINGIYYGELMQGGMAPVSRWDGMVFSAY